MIRGFCRTDDSAYATEEWPREFVAVSRKGDEVESKSGRRLRVIGIAHLMSERYSLPGSDNVPGIEVKLGR